MSLKDNTGNEYISLDKTNAYIRRDIWKGDAVVGSFLLLWIAFIFFSIRIGRNPQNYSEKIVRLFFKDGYIHK